MSRPRLDPQAGIGWRTTIVCGLLWGLGLGSLESGIERLQWAGAAQLLQVALTLIVLWCAAGLGWAATAKIMSRRPRLFPSILAWMAMSLAGTSLQLVLLSAPLAATLETLGGRASLSTAIYMLWINAIYGGIYFAGYSVTAMAARSRQNVLGLRMALNEDGASLEEARVVAARSQIQPEIVIDALRTAEARYPDYPKAADQTINHLITFLRVAVRNRQSRVSTLKAELDLAAAYIRLRSSLDRNTVDWRVDVSSEIPDAAFPSQTLVPLIEDLSRSSARIALRCTVGADAACVSIRATSAQGSRRGMDAMTALHDRLQAYVGKWIHWTLDLAETADEWVWTAIATQRQRAMPV